jgi:glycosyltransferase involved in cell wall biosynthesis
MVHKLGLGERVTFDDRFVPDDEVADLVCACDWVALPYRSSFTSQSGVLNLAVHYERPVLAGAAPVLAETVNSFRIGSVGESDDSEDLLKAMLELEDTIRRRDPSLFGFGNYRKMCTWRENARITAEVYRGLF